MFPRLAVCACVGFLLLAPEIPTRLSSAATPARQQPPAPSPDAAKLKELLARCEQLRFKGPFDELAATAREARVLSQTLGDTRREAQAVNYLGAAHFFSGRFDEALAAFTEVAGLARAAGDRYFEATALNNAAQIHRNQGRFEEALQVMMSIVEFVRAMTPTADPGAPARTVRNIGILYMELGDYDRAEPFVHEALDLARKWKSVALEQASLMSLGVLAKRRARWKEAVAFFEQALALDAQVGDKGLRAEIHGNVAEAYLESGDLASAERHNRAALDLARALGARLAEAIWVGNVAMTELAAGRPSDALATLDEAFARFQAIGPTPEKEWVLHLTRARAYRTLGRPDEALAAYGDSIGTIERLRAGAVATETSRASVIATRRDPFVEHVDLLFSRGRHADALAVAERYRARAFLDQLAESRINLREALTEELRRREDDLFKRLSDLQRELWSASLRAERRRQLERDLVESERALEAFGVDVRRRDPRYASVQYPETLDADRIRQELPDAKTALVEYFLGGERSFAWIVTRDAVRMVELPARKVIEARVTAYRRALTRPVSQLTLGAAERTTRAARLRLDEAVLAPIEPALKGTAALVIVPDGALAYVPFETLGGQRSLVARTAVSYASSASALAALRREDASPAGAVKTLVAFGDPVFDAVAASGRSALAASHAERGFSFARLLHARAEVTAIANLFPTGRRQVYLGAGADEDAVKQATLAQYRYVHFATHGALDEDIPARSGLLLGRGPASAEDGLLQTREVLRLRLNADLVTLSACSTGLGRLVDGEGVLGLTRAFLYAGARSVVVSLWNVNDAATAELMRAFYQGLSRGLPKARALQAAKLRLANGANRLWRHPYYWSAFVLIGEPG